MTKVNTDDHTTDDHTTNNDHHHHHHHNHLTDEEVMDCTRSAGDGHQPDVNQEQASSDEDQHSQEPAPLPQTAVIAGVAHQLEEAVSLLGRLEGRVVAAEAKAAPSVFVMQDLMDARALRTDIGLEGERILRLMFKLDAVESNGNVAIRTARRAAVRDCEAALARSEAALARATALADKHEQLKLESVASRSADDITMTSDETDLGKSFSSDSSSGGSSEDEEEQEDAMQSDDDDEEGEEEEQEEEDQKNDVHEPSAHLEEKPNGIVHVVITMPKLVDLLSVSLDLDDRSGRLDSTGRHGVEGRFTRSFQLPTSLAWDTARIIGRDHDRNTLSIAFATRRAVVQQQLQQKQRQRQMQLRQQREEEEAMHRRRRYAHGRHGLFDGAHTARDHGHLGHGHPFGGFNSIFGF